MKLASLAFVLGAVTASVSAFHSPDVPVGPVVPVAPAQSVQYRSPAGVEYRSLPATEAITKAQAALGAKFDLRAFHDVVLGRGGVTLPMLREQVGQWMESAR